MKTILILGVGSFGATLAEDLTRRGNEVVVVDKDEKCVNTIKDTVDKAIIADVTHKEVLEQLYVSSFDMVVVNLRERVDASILTALCLKQMGARKIIVRATSEEHVAVLKSIGVDQAVFPERDVALRLSRTISNSNVLDHVVLAPGFGLVELTAPGQFVGKTLKELDLSNRFCVQMVFARRSQSEEVILPRADFVIRPNDTLVFIGRDADLKKLDDLSNKVR